jgi:outer membrane beta-barrel protein
MKRLLLAIPLLLAPAVARAGVSDGPVVRPQIFTSSNKLELGFGVGYVSNDPYNRIIVPAGIISYHWNDRSAFEVHLCYGLYSGKQLLSQVRQKHGQDPDVVSRPQFFASGNYVWTPVYGKINAFGEVVLHYDLFVLAGLGVASDQIETANVANPNGTFTNKIFPLTDLSIGQRFFLSRKVALRIEVRPYIFWEQIDNKITPNGDVQILTGLSLLL